jgi:hypothetical protein
MVGEQAEHDRVPAPAFERHVRAKQSFAREPAAGRDALRRVVVRPARELQARNAEAVEGPAGKEPDGARGDAASA